MAFGEVKQVGGADDAGEEGVDGIGLIERRRGHRFDQVVTAAVENSGGGAQRCGLHGFGLQLIL